jgi:hypothetical protein
MSADPVIGFGHIGQEHQPLLVIDNFFPDPDALVMDASGLAFDRMGPHYPGVRALLSQGHIDTMLKTIMPIIQQTFDIAGAINHVETLYSVVTAPPTDLAPIQRLPHFDGLEEGRIAVLLYLCGPEQGGTAFYRHRSTGYETVTADRFDRFSKSLVDDLASHGLPPAAYISGDTEIYEQTARQSAAFNRAIVYRSVNLHCADLPSGLIMSDNPAQGRLTVNMFLMADVYNAA